MRSVRPHCLLRASRQYSTKQPILDHVHLSKSQFTPYAAAEAAQEEHRSRFLSWKANPGDSSPPRPLLLSFESTPTFTLGRRQEELHDSQLSRLQRPLHVRLLSRSPPVDTTLKPEVKKTNRGGLTTYHGPGQLVFWPVIDMHSALYPKFGVASYAAHLETTTQRLLRDLFGVQTYTNKDEPGVWVKTSSGQERKIAALGVHHRRYVTALGIAVNIDIPVTGDEDVNSWARFVPCGLDGKLVTSVASEMGDAATGKQFNMEELAGKWAARFDEGLLDASKREFDS